MGSKNSVLTPEEIEDFTELTFLTKQEVLHCFSRYRSLDPELVDSHPLQSRIPAESVRALPEFQHNPFADRLCHVFSSSEDSSSLSFEDFLDLASAMSEHAPAQLKADWAFKIFDFDGDENLGPEDIKMTVRRLTGHNSSSASEEARLSDLELDKIVKYVLAEADLNKSGTITPQEFRYIMSKSPDFAHNFRLRL